jgi:hypothetical protein
MLPSRRRAELAHIIVNGIATTIMVVTVSALISWVLVNWISGCGELIHTADGLIIGECIMVPWAQ